MSSSASAELGFSAEQVAIYRREGFLVLRRVLRADEVSGLQEECERVRRLPGLLDPGNLRTRVLTSEERPADRLDPVIDLSPPFAALAADPRVLVAVGAMLDDDARLFKDKLILKPPGMTGYKTHQDYAYWTGLQVPADALLTAVVSLDAADASNGALEIFPRRHDALLAPPGAKDLEDLEGDLGTGEVLETEPGDVIVFHSLAPHRSGANRSSAPRRQLFFSYAPASYGDLRKDYYDYLQRSLRDELQSETRKRVFYR